MDYRLTSNSVGGIYVEDLYNYSVKKSKENVIVRFFSWCKTQERNRYLWLSLTFFGQIGLTLPSTAFFIVFLGGNSMFLWALICAVNLPLLVLNLAALSTKIMLPFLFFGWLMQLVIIVYCIGFTVLH